MNQAITNLLPKNDEKELLKDWRLIFLLYADYKILTKIVSNRFKPTQGISISKEQTCGIPNRLIQNTSNYNWEICISNLAKQVQQLSRRHLSLRGKTILFIHTYSFESNFLKQHISNPDQNLETNRKTDF